MNDCDNMKCEKCGKEISSVLVDTFNCDGTDGFYPYIVNECEENAAYIDASKNWTGYELSEEEMIDTVRCPYCNEFPFKNKEIQIYEIVRLVFFKDGDINARIQNS